MQVLRLHPPISQNTSSKSLALYHSKAYTHKLYKDQFNAPFLLYEYKLNPLSLCSLTFSHNTQELNLCFIPSKPCGGNGGSLCPGSLAGYASRCVCVFTRRLLHSSPIQHSTLLVLPPAHTTSLFHQLLIQELPHPKIQHPSLLLLWFLLPLPLSPSSLTPVVLHAPEALRPLSSDGSAGKLEGCR